MKHLIILTLLVTIVGCSVDNPTQDSYTETQTDAGTGLVLKPSQDMWVSFQQIVNIYLDTEACMGMTAEAPTVEYKDFLAYGWGLGDFGLYHSAGFIFINTYATETPLGIERDERADVEVLKHEFVHHILNFNGLDWKHGNPMFEQCGIGVNTYN